MKIKYNDTTLEYEIINNGGSEFSSSDALFGQKECEYYFLKEYLHLEEKFIRAYDFYFVAYDSDYEIISVDLFNSDDKHLRHIDKHEINSILFGKNKEVQKERRREEKKKQEIEQERTREEEHKEKIEKAKKALRENPSIAQILVHRYKQMQYYKDEYSKIEKEYSNKSSALSTMKYQKDDDLTAVYRFFSFIVCASISFAIGNADKALEKLFIWIFLLFSFGALVYFFIGLYSIGYYFYRKRFIKKYEKIVHELRIKYRKLEKAKMLSAVIVYGASHMDKRYDLKYVEKEYKYLKEQRFVGDINEVYDEIDKMMKEYRNSIKITYNFQQTYFQCKDCYFSDIEIDEIMQEFSKPTKEKKSIKPIKKGTLNFTEKYTPQAKVAAVMMALLLIATITFDYIAIFYLIVALVASYGIYKAYKTNKQINANRVLFEENKSIKARIEKNIKTVCNHNIDVPFYGFIKVSDNVIDEIYHFFKDKKTEIEISMRTVKDSDVTYDEMDDESLYSAVEKSKEYDKLEKDGFSDLQKIKAYGSVLERI